MAISYLTAELDNILCNRNLLSSTMYYVRQYLQLSMQISAPELEGATLMLLT